MTEPDERRPRSAAPQHGRERYSVQRMTTLDGVLVHVARDGETVGFAFGATDEIAATAADALRGAPTVAPGGADR